MAEVWLQCFLCSFSGVKISNMHRHYALMHGYDKSLADNHSKSDPEHPGKVPSICILDPRICMYVCSWPLLFSETICAIKTYATKIACYVFMYVCLYVCMYVCCSIESIFCSASIRINPNITSATI
jgi:hypothetical protein